MLLKGFDVTADPCVPLDGATQLLLQAIALSVLLLKKSLRASQLQLRLFVCSLLLDKFCL
jgi:hypothetical protein